MSEYVKIPAIFMRGGTSKGVYIMMKDLPDNQADRDAAILAIYGSPDVRQISGMGGGDPLTSKVALLAPSTRDGVDIDYTFGYVGIGKSEVDYEGNCGNISSGVGVFALMTGIVKPQEPITKVRIFNTNTNKVIEASVQVKDGEAVTRGDYSIAGVHGTGAAIELNFPNSAGSKTGKLLPTGNVVDEITLKDGRKIKASLVDAANPAIFVQASDLGLVGTEMPADAEARPEIIAMLDDVRTTGAVMMGLAKSKETASNAVPKVAMVAAAQDYPANDGSLVVADTMDLVARTLALGVMHKTYAVTGGICLATAALIEGSVVNEVLSERAKKSGEVKIAHPSGILEVFVDLSKVDAQWVLNKAGVCRTAKPIMEGMVYVPAELYKK